MLTARVALVISALLCALALPAVAHADGGTGNVTCQNSECSLWASTPGHQPASGTTTGGGSGKAPSSGTPMCKDNIGTTVPCTSPEYGTIGPNGCYMLPVLSANPAPKNGTYMEELCNSKYGITGMGQIVFVPNSPAAKAPAAAPPRVAPAVLAAQAESRLPLAAPVIEANPAPAHELVRLPVWVFLASGSWSTRSATASVPGESVTATATPMSVTWNFGDDTTLTRLSAGTPWSPMYSATAPSPTCGHTYVMSSAGQPNHAYAVTATLRWSVTWRGAGTGGVFPDLTRTADAAFRVAQIQTVDVQ